MPDRGENITTKFKVDISDLKKGISDANQQIKLANAQFKAASAGMDDWQKSTEGVKAKLSQLDSVLAGEKAKLAAYTEQLNRQKTAYAENGKRAEELRSKMQQLASNGVSKTSAEYKALEKELAACEKEQDANKRSVDSLSVTVLNQQAAVNKTEAEIRKYSTSLDELEKEQREASQSSDDLDSALEKTGGASDKASGGFSVMDGVLSNLVASGIKAAIQGLKDLADAAFQAWKAYDEGEDIIIAATGATGDQAAALVGSMENVARNVVADMSEIGTAIGEVSTRFGFADEQLEDTTERFLKFAKLNGTDVKSSVDSVSKAMMAWDVPAKDTGNMLDLINAAAQRSGESVDSITASITANAPVLREMGMSVSDATILLSTLGLTGVETSDVMAGLKKAMTNATKEGKPLGDAIGDVEEAIWNAKDSTEAISIASEMFGNKAGPAIATAIRDGRLSFDELGWTLDDFAGNLDTTFDATQDVTDSIALAFQNLKLEGAKLVGELLDKYGPQIEAAIQWLTEKAMPMVTQGIGFVVDAVSAFADKYGPQIQAAISGIAEKAIPVIVQIRDALAPLVEAAFPLLVQAIEFVIGVIGDLVNAFIVLRDGFAEVAQGFVAGWEEAKANWNEAVQYFADLWAGIQDALSDVEQWFNDMFTAAWRAIAKAWAGAKRFFANIWSSIKGTFNNAHIWFRNKFTAAWNAIKNAWSTVVAWFANIWSSIQGVFALVHTWFRDKFTAAWDAIKNAWSTVTAWFSDVWSSIKDTFDEVADWFGRKFSAAWDAVVDAFSGWVDYWRGLWHSVQTIFSELGTKIGDAISGAVRAGINGIISQAESVINRGIGLINDAIDLINRIPGVDIGYVREVEFPRLERGGVLRRGQVGLLEGSGAEAVVPLDQNKAWIHALAEDLRAEMASQPAAIAAQAVAAGHTTTYTQIINAPKQPSRIELYRQTRNLLALTGGAASV